MPVMPNSALEAQFRQSFVAGELRYPHHSGATWAQQREDHDDLYAYAPEHHAQGGEKPSGFLSAAVSVSARRRSGIPRKLPF